MNSTNLSHIPYTKDLKILDAEPEKYNGRVQIMEPPAEILFNMQERINVRNKETNFREPLHEESNMLKTVFFCAENVAIIQNGIKSGVFERSKQSIHIPNQNTDTLHIIMYSIYADHAKHQANDITGQVEELNKLVLDYAVNNVYNEAVAYTKYLHDQSTLVVPFARSMQTDRDHKHMEHKVLM